MCSRRSASGAAPRQRQWRHHPGRLLCQPQGRAVPRWIAKAPTILSVTADYHGRQNVSHIFRRENGEWKIAHRHTDYVPIDQTLREAV
jgi:hypothetical protein